MAWNKIGNLAALSLSLILAACGGDSGSNASSENINEILQSGSSAFGGWSSTNLSSQEIMNITNYTDTSETVEELLFGTDTLIGYGTSIYRHPCLGGKSAYVRSTKEVYVCIPNQSDPTQWSWQPYQEGGDIAIRKDGLVYKTFVDSRDGNIYSMGYSAGLILMFENLRFDTGEGDSCLLGYNPLNFISREFCDLGRIYSQYVALDGAGIYSSNGKGCTEEINYDYTRVLGKDCNPLYPMRGICPQGWHIPDSTELKVNVIFPEQEYHVGSEYNAKYTIKTQYDMQDYNVSIRKLYWTSTYATAHVQHYYFGDYDEVKMFYLYNNSYAKADGISYAHADRLVSPKTNEYYSVRCVKDDNVW